MRFAANSTLSFTNQSRASESIECPQPVRLGQGEASARFATTQPLAPPLPPDGESPRLVLSSAIWDLWQKSL